MKTLDEATLRKWVREAEAQLTLQPLTAREKAMVEEVAAARSITAKIKALREQRRPMLGVRGSGRTRGNDDDSVAKAVKELMDEVRKTRRRQRGY